MSWAVVVPTVRPEKCQQFLEAWKPLFEKHQAYVIVVQDQHKGDSAIGSNERWSWSSIRAKHIPRQTDMIRSWGIYRAYKRGAKYTLTLDDDVLPSGDPFSAYERVFQNGAPFSAYLDVGSLTSYGKPLRGFPFVDREPREVAVQYGGWHGVLDYDAPTQIAGVPDHERFYPVVVPVPRDVPVTGCIMNAAWRTEYSPIMWQLPLLNGRYNRFGDIWAGLFAKKTLDVLGKVMVINGEASVVHERASDPVKNLEREAPGIPLNEQLWDGLDVRGDLIPSGMVDLYKHVTDRANEFFARHDLEYARHFQQARDEWLTLVG